MTSKNPEKNGHDVFKKILRAQFLESPRKDVNQ